MANIDDFEDENFEDEEYDGSDFEDEEYSDEDFEDEDYNFEETEQSLTVEDEDSNESYESDDDDYNNFDDFEDEDFVDTFGEGDEDDGITGDTEDADTVEDTDIGDDDSGDTVEDTDGEDEVSIKNNTFTDEFGNIVVQEKDGENFRIEYINIENIVVPNKRVRKDAGVEELMVSIRSTGLLCPILVAPLATEGTYVLIKGKRRLLAMAKTGKKVIPCIVNAKIRTTEIAIIEALYNHYRAYTIKEIIDFIDYLEKEKGVTRGDTIEYLLQMNSGDYAKLKDVLTDDDEEIVTPLLNGEITIDKAFKNLEKRRKAETKEQQQKDKAEKVFNSSQQSDLSGLKDSGEDAGEGNLNDEDIKELGINLGNLDEDLDEKSLDDMVEEGKQMKGFEPHQQDVKNRERMDPAIRKAILARDNNTCQCCELGGASYLSRLDTHHVIPVFLGGKDEVDNGVTLCVLCHGLVHDWSTGDLQIPKSKPEEEVSQMSAEDRALYEFEQKRFKRVIKLGNYIRKGMQAKGVKREALRKATYEANPGRNKPGQGQKPDL